MGEQEMASKEVGVEFSVKSHVSQGEVLVAACDVDILGKTFEEGDLQIQVGEGFYGGERIDTDRMTEMIGLATILNLIGKRVVRLAIELGYVDEDAVMTIDGVPHAQVFVLN